MSENPTQPMFCYAHPNRETLLRCNRCERPMCTSCAVLTPTGYRCKECVRGQQKTFDTALWWDYPVAVVIAGLLGFFGNLLANMLGFFALLLALVGGAVIAEAVRRALHKRRSRNLPIISAAAAFVGSIAPALVQVVILLVYGSQSGFDRTGGFFLVQVIPILFSIILSSTVYYRLKGIRV